MRTYTSVISHEMAAKADQGVFTVPQRNLTITIIKDPKIQSAG